MTNTPIFRVLPKTDTDVYFLNRYFPDGIPCNRIVHPMNDFVIPETFGLNISFEHCSDEQMTSLIAYIQANIEVPECEILSKGISINFKDIDTCYGQNGHQINLENIKTVFQ